MQQQHENVVKKTYATGQCHKQEPRKLYMYERGHESVKLSSPTIKRRPKNCR